MLLMVMGLPTRHWAQLDVPHGQLAELKLRGTGQCDGLENVVIGYISDCPPVLLHDRATRK